GWSGSGPRAGKRAPGRQVRRPAANRPAVAIGRASSPRFRRWSNNGHTTSRDRSTRPPLVRRRRYAAGPPRAETLLAGHCHITLPRLRAVRIHEFLSRDGRVVVWAFGDRRTITQAS